MRRRWPLLVIAAAGFAGISFLVRPIISKPVVIREPISQEEREALDKLRSLGGPRKSTEIQTGAGDAHFTPGEALLIFPPTNIVKPKPNEGDTDSHWYSDEAASAERRFEKT